MSAGRFRPQDGCQAFPWEDRRVRAAFDIAKVQTEWPVRLRPLLEVLKELRCESLAAMTRQLVPDAARGTLTLCTIVGRSSADLKPFLNDLTAAIHRRPNDNDLWRDVCSAMRAIKVPEGLVVVFEHATGTLGQTVH
jgi:hypothetical protein